MNDESHFLQIDSVMLYLEDARRRTERAIADLKQDGGEPHLIEALQQTQDELSETAKRLRQGTFFAVPDPQLTL